MTGSVVGGGEAAFLTCIGSLHCLVVAARSIDRVGAKENYCCQSQSEIYLPAMI
jgi:hypothetical protein